MKVTTHPLNPKQADFRRLFLTVIAFWCAGLYTYAQLTVKGSVTDAEAIPLSGVTILNKGTRTGATTDANGYFEITVPNANTVLVFSFLGFETKEVVAAPSYMNVILSPKDETLGEIVLVGSRNPNRSKTNTSVPVDVIGLQEIKNVLPQTTLNDLLSYLAPSFNNTRQSASDGTEHIDPASLRGLGPDQVLVLVNGKRRHTTSLVNNQSTFGNGSVGTDLSAIPTSAIARVEVLRDGASAQYGSDAIAGVINLILKENTGLEVNTTYGQTSRQDGETVNVNLNYSKKIGALGGFMNLSVEYNSRQKTNRSQNHNLVIFDQAEFGNFFAYDFSNENARSIDDGLLADYGLNRDYFNFQVGDAAIENVQGFLNMELPTSEKAAFYLFGGINVRHGEGFGFRRLPSETENVVPELFPFGFQPSLLSKVNDVSLSTGYRFKWGEWNFDVSNTLGENNFHYTVDNTNNFSLGVLSPTRFDAGGHRFFQDVINVDAQTYFPGVWKGLNIALGTEYRNEQYHIEPGEPASYIDGGAQSFPGFSSLNQVDESRQSIAGYADVEADVTEDFLLGLAGRYENYNDFGSTLNGKLTARWQFAEGYAFRAAASTGFRAPSLHQRYFNNIATDIVDGELLNSGIFRNDSEIARQLGIPKLTEETSVNLSAGFTLKPMDNLLITIDGYKIDIKDRIILTGNLGNDPFGGDIPELQDLFEVYGAATGRFFANAVDTQTWGVDIVVDYNVELGAGKLTSSLLYNLNKNKVGDEINNLPAAFIGQEDVYFGPQERSLIETNMPRQKAVLNLSYKLNKLNLLLRNTYFGEVIRNGFPFGISQTHAGKVVTDASVSYNIASYLQLTAGANNLLDVFPDEQAYENSYFGVFRYAPVQMGTTGAFYFARLSFKW